MTYTANILMQQSATWVLQSVSGDISGRVDGVLRLLTGLASDECFADTSKPLFDRAINGKSFLNLSTGGFFFNSDADTINKSIKRTCQVIFRNGMRRE